MFILASFVSALKVASLSNARYVDVFYDIAVIKVAYLLLELGYILGITILNKSKLRVYLKYNRKCSTISSINLISKPSSKIYLKKSNIEIFLNKSALHFIIFSTDKDIITDVELLFYKIGGEPLIVFR